MLFQIGNTVKLIYAAAEENSSIKYYVRKKDIFVVIHDAHLAICDGGRNRMIMETQTKYKNITAESRTLFKFVRSLHQKMERSRKCFGDQANDI